MTLPKQPGLYWIRGPLWPKGTWCVARVGVSPSGDLVAFKIGDELPIQDRYGDDELEFGPRITEPE